MNEQTPDNKEKKVVAIIALTLAILALLLSGIPIITPLVISLAGIATILGIVALIINKENRKGYSLSATLISIVAMVFVLVISSLYLDALNAIDTFNKHDTSKQVTSSKKETKPSESQKEIKKSATEKVATTDSNNSDNESKTTPSTSNPNPTPVQTPKPTPASTPQVVTTSQSYNSIFDQYSQKIIDTVPSLIEEYKKEAAANTGNNQELANIVNSKIEKLAVISNEGVSKMAERMLNSNSSYNEYEGWAQKLIDVYIREGQKIWDFYIGSPSSEQPSETSPNPSSPSSPKPTFPPFDADILVNIDANSKWYIAATNKCFVPKQGRNFYSKVKTMQNYTYMTRADAESKGYVLATEDTADARP